LNKGVAGSSSAELLATFCDNILKKGGSERLSDEAIEDSLEKVLFCEFLCLSSHIFALIKCLFAFCRLLSFWLQTTANFLKNKTRIFTI